MNKQQLLFTLNENRSPIEFFTIFVLIVPFKKIIDISTEFISSYKLTI